MKMRNLLHRVASIGAACIALVAVVSVNSACFLFYYQPKMPANLSQRLKKS